MEEKLESDNLNDSCKQALCSKLEQLVTKLDLIYAAFIQIVKSELATGALTTLPKSINFYQDLLKQYQKNAESGNQTPLVSSTSADDEDPNEPVIDK